jgi:hypothetical protein
MTCLLVRQDAHARLQGRTDPRNIAFRWPPVLRCSPRKMVHQYEFSDKEIAAVDSSPDRKPFLFGWTRECSAGRGSARPRGRFHVRPQNRSRPKHPNGAPAPSQSPHTLPAIIFGPLNSLCCTLFLRMALLHVPSAYPDRSGFCGAVHGKRPPTKD